MNTKLILYTFALFLIFACARQSEVKTATIKVEPQKEKEVVTYQSEELANLDK